jgi:hypothetical protein
MLQEYYNLLQYTTNFVQFRRRHLQHSRATLQCMKRNVESWEKEGVPVTRTARPSTAKWLLLCFPYGLYLMWRKGCGWSRFLKISITALFALAAAAIFFMPAPERASGTRVVLVGAEPVAEVFGPALPEGYDAAAYYVHEEDEPLLAGEVAVDTVYVYASASEESTYYHTSICKFAYASSRRMTLYEAYMLGYDTPCQLCNPPVYVPGD